MERGTSAGGMAQWRAWVWLFPATYLVHITEELMAGGGFPAWASRQTGLALTASRFVLINGVALAVMLIWSVLAWRRRSFLWLGVTLGVIVGINGVLHAVASLATRSYSPGAVSGVVLWIPLGTLAVHVGWCLVRPKVFWTAVILGLVVQGLVVVVAATATRGC